MWKLPRPLYKYALREHAEALAHRGMVHLGTLDAYRDMEKLGTEIGDDQEGLKRLTGEIVAKTGDMMNPFESLFFGRNPGLYVANTGIRLTVADPNCWLFCTSARLSARVMRNMKKGYNACVEIFDPFTFGGLIADKLWSMNLITEEPRAMQCVYRKRDLPHDQDDGLEPVRLKAPRYAEQEEVRFVYRPLAKITELYLPIEVPDIVKCCTVLETIPE